MRCLRTLRPGTWFMSHAIALPRPNRVLHKIALLKGVERAGLHLGMVEEQIPLVCRDEPEALISDDFLDLSLWHSTELPKSEK